MEQVNEYECCWKNGRKSNFEEVCSNKPLLVIDDEFQESGGRELQNRVSMTEKTIMKRDSIMFGHMACGKTMDQKIAYTL